MRKNFCIITLLLSLTLFLILISILLTGCNNEIGQPATIDEVVMSEETSALEIKEALNALDESEDDLSKYKFLKYSHTHRNFVDGKFSESVEAQVDFYYAKKGAKLIFVFPPDLELIGLDDVIVDSLFDINYILDGNKIVLSTRIHAEKDVDESIARLIEMIAISIEV